MQSTRFALIVALAVTLLICACSHVMPPGPVVKNEEPETAMLKRQEEYAKQAVENLKRRKKLARQRKPAPEVAWEEDLRKTEMARSRVAEQKTVDDMPTAILRPKRPDAESIAEVDSKPEFEEQKPLMDSQHASLHHYREGLALMEGRNWDEAIGAFAKFVDTEPNHIYADRAAYWISHCHFMAGDHGLAIVTSNKFESRYPHSPRLPEAIYYRALSHVELGQYEEAAPELRALLARFPSNLLASEASKKLAEITVRKDYEMLEAAP